MGIPHKKIILSLIIGVGMIGTSWLFFGEGRGLLGLDSIIKQTSPLSLAEARENCADSDNDGLCDFEEFLFGTDPHNPDTDGDGISDGEQYASIKDIPDVTATDSILNYLNQVGQALNSDGQIALPEAKLTVPPDHYIKSDLRIVPTNNSSITTYVSGVLVATSIYRDVIESEPLELIQAWLETNDSGELEKIESLAQKHKDLSLALLHLDVPAELVENHLALVNSVYNSGITLENVKSTVQNPQAGFFAAALYTSYQTKRSKAILNLTNYFNTHIPEDV